MILYFSATGNCKYVAERVARALGLEALSIVDCIRAGRFAFAGEVVGIVSPTYDWGLPSIVEEFLKQARVEAEYLFFAATYGTTPGAAGYMAGRALAGRKNRRALRRPYRGIAFGRSDNDPCPGFGFRSRVVKPLKRSSDADRLFF